MKFLYYVSQLNTHYNYNSRFQMAFTVSVAFLPCSSLRMGLLPHTFAGLFYEDSLPWTSFWVPLLPAPSLGLLPTHLFPQVSFLLPVCISSIYYSGLALNPCRSFFLCTELESDQIPLEEATSIYSNVVQGLKKGGGGILHLL